MSYKDTVIARLIEWLGARVKRVSEPSMKGVDVRPDMSDVIEAE